MTLSSLTSLIPGFSWVKAAVFGLGALALVSGGAYVGYRWEAGTVATLKMQAAQERAEAVQEAKQSDDAQAKVALNAAIAEAQAQTRIITNTVTITKEVPKYVTVHQDAIVCIPVGLARVLRAAAAGSDPSAVVLAPGQSDDACSDLTASEVAGWFSEYAGASVGNAEQLNALEAEVVKNHQAQENVK